MWFKSTMKKKCRNLHLPLVKIPLKEKLEIIPNKKIYFSFFFKEVQQ